MSVERKLNSVGKEKFIRYFNSFKDVAEGRMSKESCIKRLMRDGVGNYSGSAIRVSNATRIFQEHWEVDALRIVTQSNRLAYDVVSEAQRLFRELT